MGKALAIKCACGECNFWLSRAERPKKGAVRFPLFGVFDFQEDTKTRVTFLHRNRQALELLLKAFAAEGKTQAFEIVDVDIPDGHAPGRLEGI